MALIAKITKISRNISNPQVDVEVNFSDSVTGLNIDRVLTYGDLSVLGSDPEKVVRDEIQRIGNEYKDTLMKEDILVKALVGEEIVI